MQNKNYQVWLFFTLGVYLILPVASIYHGLKYGTPVHTITANAFISIILSFALDQYVKQRQLKDNRRLQDKILFIVLFFMANMILAWGDWADYGYIWLLPVLMTAISTGMEHAAVIYVILLIQNMLLHTGDFNSRSFIMIVLYGIFCIWLMAQKLTWKVLPYLFVSMLSVDGIMQILEHQFQFTAIQNDGRRVIVELISVVVLEVFIAGYLFYREHQGKENEEERSKRKQLQKGLSIALEADYGLLLRLQEYSGPLFMHSMKISSVAAQAARYMGGNVQLAQAGGLYHEVGRIINEKDYINAGVELLKENDMPEELIDVIRQHSTSSSKPQTLEAAIVMLADCIVSTSDYLEKNGKRQFISDEKLVKGVFENRVAKGNLDEAGLSDIQISQLQDFFVKQIFMVKSGIEMEGQADE